MRRFVIWSLAALVAAGLTVLAFFPAAWLAGALEARTGGRLTLGDPQGTLWNGSAFIGGAPGRRDPVTPLLPGRFAWRLSPLALLGRLDAELENPEALDGKVSIRGGWGEWQVGPGALRLPADGLAGLGAPLNTIAPSGRVRLAWQALSAALPAGGVPVELRGRMVLELDDMASRVSSIRPLGSYRLLFDWQGSQARLEMLTVKGPLLLSGAGKMEQGRMQFSGKAMAAPGQEEALGNLLNLLGPRRVEGDKTIIALELK